MTNWIATTESGRTYVSADGCVTISSLGEHFHNAELRSFPQSMVDKLYADVNSDDVWAALNALPQVTAPVVGERLYIRTFGDAGWRISRVIAKIEWVD